jgi:uncharacterized protein (DUF983 family)
MAAIIRCPACRHTVSSRARSCTACGEPIARQTLRDRHHPLVIILILFASLFVLMWAVGYAFTVANLVRQKVSPVKVVKPSEEEQVNLWEKSRR